MLKTFKKLTKRLPKRALTNIDILNYCAHIIPHFRGVFMKDTLPSKPKQIECAIVNLDNHENAGTHWVAYVKIYNYCEYFDSFGNLIPPKEIINYLKGLSIYYNYETYQNFDSVNCGHLCIKYLEKVWKNIK